MLENIKILDFTRLLPGPLATHLLSQMGAEITKIEHPQRMDYMRYYGKRVDDMSVPYLAINHRKKHKIIDYQSEEGYQEVLQLVKATDVLVEQFRPGAMKNWKLDYETLKSINPGLVYVSLTGYGQSNAKQHEAGHDINYIANAGALSLIKDDNQRPILPGFQLGDISGGSYMAVIAIQSGIIQKQLTGKGCYLDVSMTKAILPHLTIPLQLELGEMPHEQFNSINGKTLVNYGLYECADGKWLAVGALELKFWSNLCDLVGRPDWKRQSEFDLSVHVFPRDEVEALFKSKTLDEWVQLFEGHDVCVAPVLEVSELENNPYLNSINAFETFTIKGEEIKTVALPFDVIDKGR